VPKPKEECVINRATKEENSSGDEAPAAMSVAPAQMDDDEEESA
jgi:hypothetical protein